MPREPAFDLIYTHEALAMCHEGVATQQTPNYARLREASDLNARLKCLKALMDAERDQHLGPCALMFKAKRKAPGKSRHRTGATLN